MHGKSLGPHPGLALVIAMLSACGDDGGTDLPGPSAGTGAIEVTTSTTGEDPDPDGYTLAVDGGNPISLAPNGTVAFTGLVPDTYTLSVANVAANCRLPGGTTHDVAVAAGDTVEVTLGVVCQAGDGGAPEIRNVRGPASLTVPGDTGTVAFDWADPDADVDSLVVTIARDGVLLESSTFDPDYQGATRGTAEFLVGCLEASGACDDTPGLVTLSFTLKDARGNSSNRVEFTFLVIAPP